LGQEERVERTKEGGRTGEARKAVDPWEEGSINGKGERMEGLFLVRERQKRIGNGGVGLGG